MIEPVPRSSGADDAGHGLLAFALGFYFALLQYGYFFLTEAWVSSRAVSFFFVLFFWLIGFLAGLRYPRGNRMAALLALSLGGYYVAWLVVRHNPYSNADYLVIATASLLSGLAPGHYFSWAQRRFARVGSMFFHENNGFILGIVVSMFGSLFAGTWMLQWAPLLALLGVGLVGWWRRARQAAVPEDREPASAVFPWLQGAHFGLMQVALYLLIEVEYTASALGYFLIVLAWMAGVVAGLRGFPRLGMRRASAISLAAWGVLLLCLSLLAPYPALLPVIAVLAACVALPAGVLFRRWRHRLAASSLLVHENNGFVLGYLLSMLAFVQWGLTFLYWGPVLSYGLSWLAGRGRDWLLTPVLFVIAGAAWLSGSTWVALALLALGAPGLFAARRLGYRLRVAPRPESGWARFAPLEARLVLFVSGLCLMLLQYLVTREFASILAASELSILVVGLAYFAGLSIGYGWFSRLPLAALRPAAVALFGLHLVMLPLIRPLAGAFIAAGWGMSVLWGLLFIAAFLTSTFYSILLPRFIESNRGLSLTDAYRWDLLGAGAGVLLMVFFVRYWPAAILPLYLFGMLVIIAGLFKGSRYDRSVVVVGGLLAGVLALFQGPILTAAGEAYYHSRGYDYPRLLFSGQSLYHSIDVVQSHTDATREKRQSKTAFINGVSYFRTKNGQRNAQRETGLSEFTYFLAEVPARFLADRKGRNLRVLILGAGSLTSLAHVRPYAKKTTLVEIDPLVVASSRRYWSEVNRGAGDHPNEEIVIDDARHYLMTHQEKFDLIIMDISAPYYLGTMLLHNRDFFRLVSARLKSDGLFSESTQSRPRPWARASTSMRILRSVDEVFPYWNLISTGGESRGNHGYVYAGKRDMTSVRSLIRYLEEDGYRAGSEVYSHESGRFRLDRVEPFTLSNMNSLLVSNYYRIADRLGIDSDSAGVGLGASLTEMKDRMRDRLPWFGMPFFVELFIVLVLLAWLLRRSPTENGAVRGRAKRLA